MGHPSHRRTAVSVGAVTAVLALGLTTASPSPAAPPPTTTPVSAGQSAPASVASASAAAAPKLRVITVASGLAIPWDLAFLPDRSVIYTQRSGATRIIAPNTISAGSAVSMNQSDLYVGGEAGLMGVAVDKSFSSNRRFYTCQATKDSSGRGRDVRVIRWQLSSDKRSAVRVGNPVISGIPLAGNHTGCRLRINTSGTLYVGTGDAATGTNPQNINSLGGKVLRMTVGGQPLSDNPYYSRGGAAAYVFTRGHRNVQGLAFRSDGQLYSAEHGPDRDDEVNLIRKGGNYGWDPVPGYDQGVPMTDRSKFPSAYTAVYSSGSRTRATSGTTFLTGPGWGVWRGKLAVGLLKDSGVMLLSLDSQGRMIGHADIPELAGRFGRIRTVQGAPDGSLWVTTSNGSNDKILRVVWF